MNARRRLLWVFVPALLIISVTTLFAALLWPWPWKPVPAPDPATAEILEAMAERWCYPGSLGRSIPEGEWPPELRRLGPKSVRTYPDGVFIEYGSFMVEEWGLFALPKSSTFQPPPHGDPAFRLLRGRVFRYDFVG